MSDCWYCGSELPPARAIATPADLLPIGNTYADHCSVTEERIIGHSIARARLGQPQCSYTVCDRTFDGIVRRRSLPILRDSLGAYTHLTWGSSMVSVRAGGPLISDDHVETLES